MGKDLSRITLPVGLNQPIGNLQAMAANTEYIQLLERAADEANSLRRLELVTTNMIAGLGVMERNQAKPFNCLLGETFELITPTYKFLAEQVSHHPPISAVYVKGKNFTFTGTQGVTPKFNGRFLSIEPTHRSYVDIKDEKYEICTPCFSVHNLVFGTTYTDLGG